MKAPHLTAYAAGVRDRLAGSGRDDRTWPQGTYGCADYWLGYYGVEIDLPVADREQLTLFGGGGKDVGTSESVGG